MEKLVARAQEMEKLVARVQKMENTLATKSFKQQKNHFRPFLTFVLANALRTESQVETRHL